MNGNGVALVGWDRRPVVGFGQSRACVGSVYYSARKLARSASEKCIT